MAFKIDALISYSEQDNLASEKGEGWVNDLKYFLELMLEQVIGEKPNILMREDGDTLTAADLSEVAVIIPILSPSYIQSGGCLDTLEDFGKTHEASSVNQIFKVCKSPVSMDQQPLRIRDLIGYDMYRMDEDSGNHSEFKDYFSEEATAGYWMHIVDLAFDIHDAIYHLTGKKGKSKVIGSRKAIYLASVAPDLRVQRNVIKRELQRHGYKIYPDKTLPIELEEMQRVMNQYIQQSDISIHLIGNSYGEIPEGTELSDIDLQNKLASEKVKAVGRENFPRLIWVNPNQRLSSEKQISFIENIKRDADASQGAEIYQTPLEDFKNIVREEIIDGGIDRKLNERDPLEDNIGKSVYLIHDKVDQDKIAPVKSRLEGSGFTVLLPKFEGELYDVRENHINNLRKFDGAIVYQGEVNRQWVRMKILDLLKAPGFGRNKPMKGRAVISQQTEGFKPYENQGITIIEGNGQMERELDAFIKEINS